MNDFRTFTVADATRSAEAALASVEGGPFVVAAVRDLGGDQRRNLVLRATATGADGRAKSVIIKATRAADYDSTAAGAYETSGLVKEWAAATLLSHNAIRTGGRAVLLGADLVQGVLVFEDYGEALGTLVEPLLRGSARDAEHALTAYAVALAELHAATLGCQQEHAQIIRAVLPAAAIPPPGHGWVERAPRKVIALLGGSLPVDEVMLLEGRAQAPAPWLALAHRDPCPDNVLLAADGTARLIDFEFAGPAHALLDQAYWRMGFPTCWCAGRIPDMVGARLDAAYRAALGGSLPVATDSDAFRMEQAIIAVVWALGSLAWLLDEALLGVSNWGHRQQPQPYPALSGCRGADERRRRCAARHASYAACLAR